MLLTTSAAIGLLLLLAGFALATVRGRRTLMSFDPLFALLVIVVLVLPYLIWLIRADALALPHWPAIADLSGRALHWAALLGGLLLSMSGILLLATLNSGWFERTPEEAPIIYRPPVDPLARDFVYFLAIGPALTASLISGLFDLDRVAGGAGIALMMSGLAMIVATGDLVQLRHQRLLRSVWAAAIVAPALAVLASTFFLPWTGSGEVATSLPGTAIANFFGDSFQRRTNHPLRAVTGDAQLAALISLDSGRPHLLLDAAPEQSPWLNLAKFNETGGVVVWRASDTVGTPPARYREAISRPGAGSATGVRVVRDRAPAAIADRLGHRAAQNTIKWHSDCAPHPSRRSEDAAAQDEEIGNCSSAFAMARRSCHAMRL